MPAKPYHNSSTMTRAELRNVILLNEGEIADLQSQVRIFCLIAYHRAGKISEEHAADLCGMMPDNFKRALDVADREALKIIGKMQQQLNAKRPVNDADADKGEV